MLNRGVEGLRPPFREWGGEGRGEEGRCWIIGYNYYRITVGRTKWRQCHRVLWEPR